MGRRGSILIENLASTPPAYCNKASAGVMADERTALFCDDPASARRREMGPLLPTKRKCFSAGGPRRHHSLFMKRRKCGHSPRVCPLSGGVVLAIPYRDKQRKQNHGPD